MLVEFTATPISDDLVRVETVRHGQDSDRRWSGVMTYDEYRKLRREAGLDAD